MGEKIRRVFGHVVAERRTFSVGVALNFQLPG
jgi:hypothetical protein